MSKQLHLAGKYGSIIGNYAIVDDHLYDWLKQYKWFVAINKKASGNNKLYIKAKINTATKKFNKTCKTLKEAIIARDIILNNE